nr:ComF family protein [Williamsia phyllosphaerae]
MWLDGAWQVVRAGADLVVPLLCGGCGRAGARWCRSCDDVAHDDPIVLTPRVAPPVGAWALGRYRGPLRSAILELKEHGRRDLVTPLGSGLARGLVTLAAWSELPDATELVLVPAPTRAWSARRRGGDPVTAIAAEAASRLGSRVRVAPMLRTSMWARDSAGLSARGRVDNLDHAIAVRPRARRSIASTHARAAVVLVDDVLTTGATASESIRVLAGIGVRVDAVLVIAGA